jgi:formylglycine-generating enzyme required for sulfatase activity
MMLNELFVLLSVLPQKYEEYLAKLEAAEALLPKFANFTESEIEAIRAEYIPRMTNPDLEPDPMQRAAIGRVLGLLDWDNRKGLGLNNAGLPAIDWVEIPAGAFTFQGAEVLELPKYYISRYHITYKQFKVFLDAEDGFQDSRWWEGLAERKERYEIQATPPYQVFRFWNHPFDGACWYDIIAFCRWWSNRLGGGYAIDKPYDWAVRLPTEQEWEKAAIGTNVWRFPWGNEFISGYANFDETDRFDIQSDRMKIQSGKIGKYFVGAPTAGGLFPQGASPYAVMDMVGTMWDHTLTEYRHGKNDDLVDYYPRVIRGGTWFTSEMYASVTRRTMMMPHARQNGDPRKNDYSFRVVTEDISIFL